MWVGAGFTGSFLPAVTNPNKHRDVTWQSLPADECADVASNITVIPA
jgi:hypothetical protein